MPRGPRRRPLSVPGVEPVERQDQEVLLDEEEVEKVEAEPPVEEVDVEDGPREEEEVDEEFEDGPRSLCHSCRPGLRTGSTSVVPGFRSRFAVPLLSFQTLGSRYRLHPCRSRRSGPGVGSVPGSG